jgi:hypothetical protein
MHTPVLLLIWRRPDTLRKVIDALRPVAPKILFVASDGPHVERPAEARQVAETRALIDREIDWPCQIERLYSDTNQGCRLGVSRGITWFFNQVEQGIILEDDCVPHPDFFHFCSTLLQRYQNDTRVWCISGTNFQKGQWRGDGSYYFSRYAYCWGWASWRRCWRHYDAELKHWPILRDSGLLQTIFEDPLERKLWHGIWQRLLDESKPNTWDYQWNFTCLANGGLTAVPNQNLVSNIGFGENATHTTVRKNRAASIKIDHGLDTLKAPSFLLRNAGADTYAFNHVFGGRNLKFPRSLLRLPRRVAASTWRWLNQ